MPKFNPCIVYVATCPPAGKGGVHEKASLLGQGCVFHRRKMHGVDSNVYSRKTSEKPKDDLCILKMRVRELFMHGEGISTPRARHKGRQPLIKCANHDFNITYFPFNLYFPFLYFFYVFLAFYVFYFFGLFCVF